MTATIRYKDLMDNIPGVFFRCECDENWTMQHMSNGISELTGYTVDELVGNRSLSFASLIHPQDTDAVEEAVLEAVKEQRPWSLEYRLRSRDGTYAWVSEQGIGVFSDDEKIQYLDGFVSNISKRKAIEQALRRSEERVRELAYYDSVTGLPNRNLMLDHIETQFSRSASHQILGLLYIDLDGFKAINDVYGHTVGDKVLAIIGRRLNDLVTPPSLAARVGGDEFMVLASEDVTTENCKALGDRIIESFSTPIELDDMCLHVGASVGVSFNTDQPDSAKQMISAADMAMYEVKKSGKGKTLCFADVDTSKRVEVQESLETEIVRALKENQFRLHYQPQVNTRTGDVDSVEALIRWFHPEKGLIPPADFIPVAETSGLIHVVGNWVLEHAIQQLAAWQNSPLCTLRISVNIAASQFFHGSLCNHILALLEEYDVSPSALEIEVTESIFLRDTETASKQLHVLKEAGVRVAIDDFGTGYSCLSYLQDLPLDVLKIDRSFVNRLVEDGTDHSIVHTIMQLADGLGLETVAEGVETSSQSNRVVDMGCNLIQGFYFAKPQSPEHIESVIEDIRQKFNVVGNQKVA